MGRFKFEVKGGIKRDVDKGFHNIVKLLNLLGGPQLKVDIGLPEGTDPDVIFRATVNEFGVPSKRIPARPWFSATIDANAEKYLDTIQELFWRTFKNPDEAKTANRLREEVAAIVVADLKSAIGDRKYWPEVNPPALENAPRTIKKKGFDHALVETGRLYNSIRFEMKPAPKSRKRRKKK